MMKSPILFALAAALAIPAQAVRAQVTDSVRLGLVASRTLETPDSTKPPISARRAFLSSFLLPGYGQTQLDRPKAAMLFSTLEVVSLGMAAKSAQDLRDAKAASQDSVVSTYKIDPLTGRALLDPKTGQPIPSTFLRSRFDADRVKARRVHYEDWIAALFFNHLFAAADAYVAANLWDFHANVAATPTSTRISASFAW